VNKVQFYTYIHCRFTPEIVNLRNLAVIIIAVSDILAILCTAVFRRNFCDFATNSLLFNCPRFTAHEKQGREFVSTDYWLASFS